MVIRPSKRAPGRRGSLMVELLVAMAILAGVVVPLGYSITSERRLARALYQRAVAMEILDGEMETLVAGERTVFSPGSHEYRVNAQSATNLPPGAFTLIVTEDHLRLEWLPKVKHHGGGLFREVRLR